MLPLLFFPERIAAWHNGQVVTQLKLSHYQRSKVGRSFSALAAVAVCGSRAAVVDGFCVLLNY